MNVIVFCRFVVWMNLGNKMPARGNYRKLSNQIRERMITAIVEENKTQQAFWEYQEP